MCAGIHHNLRARWQSTHNCRMFECSAGRMTRGDRSHADFMTAVRRPDRRSKIQSADPVLSQSTRPHTPRTTPTVSGACVQAFIRTCVLGGKAHVFAVHGSLSIRTSCLNFSGTRWAPSNFFEEQIHSRIFATYRLWRFGLLDGVNSVYVSGGANKLKRCSELRSHPERRLGIEFAKYDWNCPWR